MAGKRKEDRERGNILQEIRMASGVSTYDLAEEQGRSQSTIQYYEHRPVVNKNRIDRWLDSCFSVIEQRRNAFLAVRDIAYAQLHQGPSPEEIVLIRKKLEEIGNGQPKRGRRKNRR